MACDPRPQEKSHKVLPADDGVAVIVFILHLFQETLLASRLSEVQSKSPNYSKRVLAQLTLNPKA